MRWLDGITISIDMSLRKLMVEMVMVMVKDRKAWCATARGVTKSQTRLSNGTTVRAENIGESP